MSIILSDIQIYRPNGGEQNVHAPTLFNNTVEIAIAKFHTLNDLNITHKLQSIAVRQLLQQVIELNKVNSKSQDNSDSMDGLNDHHLPYRLHPNGQYVTFSHSSDCIACAISDSAIGIDTETHDIQPNIVRRFFHTDEITWLLWHYDNGRDQYDIASRLLWMIKEARLKKVSAVASSRHANVNTGFSEPPILLKHLQVNDLSIAKQLLQRTKMVGDLLYSNSELGCDHLYLTDSQYKFVTVL